MPDTVALHTIGCKLNFSETSTIGNQFLLNGYNLVPLDSSADIYVFNTCTVTENAERDCRQLIRKALRRNPNAYIIVTGCYAQLRPDEIAGIEGVDAVLGSNEKFQLFSLLNNFNSSNIACVHVGSLDDVNEFGDAHSTDADSRTRAYFKIQDGCDYNCTFCTIPLARGTSRSMDPNKAVEEFRKLVEDGYKEIILTGVNVGDYGKKYNVEFYDLLLKLIQVEGEFRIRISSIEPNLLSDGIIDLIAEEDKICNHLHIPLQSGSPEILNSMQRRYTIKDYENVIMQAHEKIIDLGIGVDIIVGFPGETENHFIETHNFLRDLPISYLHVFTYSERPDTKAIYLPNMVKIKERKRRNKILRILSEKKKRSFYENMVGKISTVLFEDAAIDEIMKGFTSNYIRIINDYDKSVINKLEDIEITGLTNDGFCTGRLMDTKYSIDIV
ncbi:MAG: tRNA (N(6)-L-threonylcarbamoyladenosine(37)-C(2))-methylthiotransferase MtaB [Ignavibacterium sp.]|nr:MAG: tRNA (N(6)-L-threonylcarbamoyladenosine(37)-C(2))-methylthiotransferase MtaB [Ignavibacterium sp.]